VSYSFAQVHRADLPTAEELDIRAELAAFAATAPPGAASAATAGITRVLLFPLVLLLLTFFSLFLRELSYLYRF